MANLTHIKSSQLYKRLVPNEIARFQDVRAEMLPVFVRNFVPSKLPYIGINSNKSLIESLSLEQLSPFVSNVSLTDIEVLHPQELESMIVNYLNAPQVIRAYYGYDPDELSITCYCSGEATDLITQETYATNAALSLTEVSILY